MGGDDVADDDEGFGAAEGLCGARVEGEAGVVGEVEEGDGSVPWLVGMAVELGLGLWGWGWG